MANIQDDTQQGVIVVEDESLREGFTQIPNLILRKQNLSPGAKLTYMGLLSYAWQKGSCFPGQDQLAEDLGISRRSLVTYLQQLKDANLLRVKRRGLGRTNIYFLPKFLSGNGSSGSKSSPSTTRSANSALQEVKDSALQEVKDLHPEEYSWKNTKIEEYEDLSSTRRIPHFEENNAPEDNSTNQPTSSSGGFESVGTVLTRTKRSPKYEVNHEAWSVILEYITDFASEFNDQASLKSSTTRAYNLFKRSGVSLSVFTQAMYAARATVKDRSTSIRSSTKDPQKPLPTKRKMAYWFSCLSDVLGLREDEEDSKNTTHHAPRSPYKSKPDLPST